MINTLPTDELGTNSFGETGETETGGCFQIACADYLPERENGGGRPSCVIFRHTNLANLVSLTDINCMSAIEWAIEILHVERIVVRAHNDCKSVAAAVDGNVPGFSGNWLNPVKRTANKFSHLLRPHPADPNGSARLCELNAIEQGVNLCRASAVTKAWESGCRLSVQSQIHDPRTGLDMSLGFIAGSGAEVEGSYEAAITEITRRWNLV